MHAGNVGVVGGGTVTFASVTVSIRVMTAGQGYRYLLDSIDVDVGDGDQDAVTGLTRCYVEAGTPFSA